MRFKNIQIFKGNSKILFVIVFIAILIRIILLFSGYTADVENHVVWTKDIIKNGFNNIIERDFGAKYGIVNVNYPPLILYLFYISHLIYLVFKQFSLFLSYHIPHFYLIYRFIGELDYLPIVLKCQACWPILV